MSNFFPLRSRGFKEDEICMDQNRFTMSPAQFESVSKEYFEATTRDLIEFMSVMDSAYYHLIDLFYCDRNCRPWRKEFFIDAEIRSKFVSTNVANFGGDINRLYKSYQETTPRCGCVILSDDRENVLLARSFRSKPLWVNPMGKKAFEAESDTQCITRELEEELGLANIPLTELVCDISSKPPMSLFMTTVRFDTKFQPKKREEIWRLG